MTIKTRLILSDSFLMLYLIFISVMLWTWDYGVFALGHLMLLPACIFRPRKYLYKIGKTDITIVFAFVIAIVVGFFCAYLWGINLRDWEAWPTWYKMMLSLLFVIIMAILAYRISKHLKV